jgi:hypothetical protein
MKLNLPKSEIDTIFKSRNKARWLKNLGVYEYLLREIDRAHEAEVLADYQRNFNYFYQVRRNAEWRKKFYDLFYGLRDFGDVRASRDSQFSFEHILRTLLAETGKVEASFASKMAATLDPSLPVIDRHVLSYIGAKLPVASRRNDNATRIENIVAIHNNMQKEFSAFLTTPSGNYLVEYFKTEYPGTTIHEMKMLDFVLWQSGGKRKGKKRISRHV